MLKLGVKVKQFGLECSELIILCENDIAPHFSDGDLSH